MTSLRSGLAAAALGAVAVAGDASRAGAQRLAFPPPYPTTDLPIAVPPGVVVRVRDQVVFRGRNVSSLTLLVESPTPPGDTSRLAYQAAAVTDQYATFAATQSIDQISVGICRTQACIEMREPPKERFEFVRGTDGRWNRDVRRDD